MQEKDKNVSMVKFLTVFGEKITGAEHYEPEWDTCDQRAPVNNPVDLYNQFVVLEPVDVADLDSETLDDFDNDIYDYEERTDLGVDIATASNISMQRQPVRSTEQLSDKDDQNLNKEKEKTESKVDAEDGKDL